MTHNIYLSDCLNGMSGFPDKYFDLAVVDPPYGIGADVKNSTDKKQSKKSASKSNNYGSQKWDSDLPDLEYFDQLKRVSKKQVIWGANYFGFKGGYLYWHKNVTMPTYSQGELAWLSWLNKIDFLEITWHGMLQQNMANKEQRIHPTQKPVALYDWIYKNYLPNGGKVLDTHGGSMSNLISAIKAGNIEMDIYELDPDYYKDAKQRVTDFCKQLNIFQPQPVLNWIT